MSKNKVFSRLIETGEFRVNDDGTVALFGEYNLMMPLNTFVFLQHQLEEEMGEENAAEFLRKVGRFQTEQAFKRYKDRYDIDNISRNQIREFVEDVASVLGMGRFKIQDVEEKDKKAQLINETNPIAQRYKSNYGETDEPIDHYICGLIDIGIGALFDEECVAVEEQCMAKGDDACVFHLHSKD